MFKISKRIDLESSHHKKEKKNCSYVWWQILTRLIVVTILQYKQIWNHHILHLNLLQCYVSIKPQ